MSSVIIAGNTSGTITLDAPAVAGTTTLTLPATSGTIVTTGSTFAGTGPAFSAYANGNTTTSSGAFTKIAVDTKVFDTANAFNTSTYRFTPQVAGYYQINGNIQFGTSTTSFNGLVSIFKNGIRHKDGNFGPLTTHTSFLSVSCLVYLNGSTDYVELYGYQNTAGSLVCSAGDTYTYLQASMVRAA